MSQSGNLVLCLLLDDRKQTAQSDLNLTLALNLTPVLSICPGDEEVKLCVRQSVTTPTLT